MSIDMPPTLNSIFSTITGSWVYTSDHRQLFPAPPELLYVLINTRLHIITTTALKGVSDGDHVAIYPTMDSNIECLLEKHNLSKDDSL